MSRLPPLPPGMPPRPSGPPGSYGGDPYRPQNDNHRSQNENYRDQRGNENYGPHNPPPMYEFRGSYDRRSPPRYGYAPGTEPIRGAGDTYRLREGPRDGDFTFRYDAPGPTAIKFGNAETYRPRSPRRPRSPPRLRERARDNGSQYRPSQRGGRGNYRGRGGPRLASEREFLKGNRAPTPELMPGMDEDDGHGVRYMPVEDVSDSDEAEMDLSEEENDDINQPKKKHVLTETKAVDADQAPRWSNPDPYTALPPPDESLRKKKDVVKLIRKARVNAISENTSPAEAAADDFISLDFGDESEDDYEPPTQMGHGVAGAPTGPRSAQRDNSHESSYEQHPEPKAALLNRMPQDAQTPPSKVSCKTAATVDLTPDPTLGNRKRNIRDEIKGPPIIHDTTKGKRPPSDGSIVRAWVAPKGSSGTPWVNVDHSDTPKMGVW
jgi:non-canonical poly(A) RNA polymerase PAPD5/7